MVESAPRTILVSACLLGLRTRYDKENRENSAVLDMLRTEGWTPIPVCPEQLGGLSTPRPKAEFISGDGTSLINGHGHLIDSNGVDVTTAFLNGAEQTAIIAALSQCRVALLKDRSPSCGVHNIYRNGKLCDGTGVTTACLKQAGLQVVSEDDIDTGILKTEEVYPYE